MESMTKFFYIVDHFVPFPTSEYGGVWNVMLKVMRNVLTLSPIVMMVSIKNTIKIFVKTF